MTSTIRAAFLCVCLVSVTSGQDLLVPVFDKPRPETRRDLLTIQQAAAEIAKRAIPCTVGLQLGGAMGSGVMISEDGYILTAAHVVGRPGRDVKVLFPDGKMANAKSLGMHTSADGALVKIIDEGRWPYLPLIEENQAPKVGDWCLALGHPGGFDPDREPPVRLGRVIDIVSTVLRTDCPITGGDSGGPLLDMQGRVIGIHSRITESMTENYHVPSLACREAWDAMMSGELYPKPIASRFLSLLDSNNDGRLTKSELSSNYHQRVFDRLVEEFELDVDADIQIDEVATKKFNWRRAIQAPLVEIEDLRMANIALSASDFVRGENIERLFTNTLTHANEVTVRVFADGRRVALGTIVDRDGLILTKASRLPDDKQIDCLLWDDRRLPAEIIARDESYDLAMLRVNASGLTTPDWNNSPPQIGTWVSVPNLSGRLESLGVIGVGPRRIRELQPLLGVRLDQNVVNEALIEEVVARSGAARAGLEKGDVVVKVEDRDVFSTEQIRKTLREFRAGDTIAITVRRQGQEKKFDVLLLSEAESMFQMGGFRMGGNLSRRRDGFEWAFQIDAIIEPKHCGGPVVDVDGRIVGVTLARADRVASYAVSPRDLIPIVERLSKSADVFQAKATKPREVD